MAALSYVDQTVDKPRSRCIHLMAELLPSSFLDPH